MSYKYAYTQIKDSFNNELPILHNMLFLDDKTSVLIYELSNNFESKFYLNIHKQGKHHNHVFNLLNKRNIKRIEDFFPNDNYDNFLKHLNILFLMQQ